MIIARWGLSKDVGIMGRHKYSEEKNKKKIIARRGLSKDVGIVVRHKWPEEEKRKIIARRG